MAVQPAAFGSSTEAVEIGSAGGMGGERVPQVGRADLVPSGVAAVLVEVIGGPVADDPGAPQGRDGLHGLDRAPQCLGGPVQGRSRRGVFVAALTRYLQRCLRRSSAQTSFSLPVFDFVSTARRICGYMCTPQTPWLPALFADGFQTTAVRYAGDGRSGWPSQRARTDVLCDRCARRAQHGVGDAPVARLRPPCRDRG